MPNNGSVHSIHITAVASEPTVSVEEARAVAGKGLEGDRYFSGDGSWSEHARHRPPGHAHRA